MCLPEKPGGEDSDQSERAGQAEMSPQARFPGRWASFQTFGKVGEGSAGMALYGLPRRRIFWKARSSRGQRIWRVEFEPVLMAPPLLWRLRCHKRSQGGDIAQCVRSDKRTVSL